MLPYSYLMFLISPHLVSKIYLWIHNMPVNLTVKNTRTNVRN